MVDPKSVPYLGAAVATYRAGMRSHLLPIQPLGVCGWLCRSTLTQIGCWLRVIARSINKISQISNLKGNVDEHLSDTIKHMDRGVKSHAAESTLYAAIDVAITCLPLVDFFTLIPGVQQQLLMFGKFVCTKCLVDASQTHTHTHTHSLSLSSFVSARTQGAQIVAQSSSSAIGAASKAALSTTAGTAVLVGAAATSSNMHSEASRTVTDNFGSTKAFICYLGLPMDDDIHYKKYVCDAYANHECYA
jgi:hypothetical protein